MKRKTVLALAVILLGCFIVADPALAREPRSLYVGLSGLYAFENLDEGQSEDKFAGPMKIEFDDNGGIQGRIGYAVNPYITVEALAEYIFPFKDEAGSNSDELDVAVGTLNAKITWPLHEKFIPYLVVGCGAMNAYEQIKFNGAKSDESDWGFAARGGIGLDYYFNPAFSLNLEAAYNAGFGDVDHVRYTTIGLGVAYHF